ncbi:MAG: DUF6489 family protein [Parvibaculaceae bacterium]|nr:DUF6489 family protein [Parvibaculaceae bacterium]
MKVKVDVDMTAEEARTLMGLPDVKPMQERLMAQFEKQVAQNFSYIDPDTIARAVMPMGTQGLEKFNELMWSMARNAMGQGKEGHASTATGAKKDPK